MRAKKDAMITYKRKCIFILIIFKSNSNNMNNTYIVMPQLTERLAKYTKYTHPTLKQIEENPTQTNNTSTIYNIYK